MKECYGIDEMATGTIKVRLSHKGLWPSPLYHTHNEEYNIIKSGYSTSLYITISKEENPTIASEGSNRLNTASHTHPQQAHPLQG
jgi:hypothetical protein